jgi:ATP-dependent DNA ligase
MSSFPTLYGEASTGKAKTWSVRVESRIVDGVTAGVLIVSHGYMGGKMQVNERVVMTGKNIGKKNETTPVQQAVSEAQALWNKKRDAGYGESLSASGGAAGGAGTTAAGAAAAEDSDAGEAAVTSAGGVPLPMLAQDYNKRGKDIKFPCYAQRKLDGVRCVAIAGKGLFSRNGKLMSAHLTAIRAEIDSLPAGTILDGELYADKEHLSFQEIVGLAKKETLKAGDAEKIGHMYLCVYDTIMDGTNKERKKWLEALFAANSFAHLRLLPTAVCNSIEDAKFFHAQYVAEGYEGLILRNVKGAYKVGHRSKDLQKYKEFLDEEFPIVGFKQGDGVEKGCVIWTCKTAEGTEFDCRPRGTREDRCALFRDGAKYIGKPLSIRFQEWTDDKIPRFPVGLAIRDYE